MQVPRTPVRVIAAPMAGGPSTPALAAAVSNAGGLGFLAAGYLSAEALSEQVRQTAALTGHPFGVNVFVPPPVDLEPSVRDRQAVALARYAERLRDDAAALRVGLRAPREDEDDTDEWHAKIAVLTGPDAVPLVSFTFGCPPRDVVADLHRAGSAVLVTVTDPAEGRAALAVGADGLIVQGFEAGGHRGTHRVDAEPNPFDHLALLPMLADLGVPLIAAGGVTTAGDTRRALGAGATAVQAGTAFLLTPEAGTSPAHRMGLSDPQLTSVITRAFSGRPARGLRNRFVVDHDAAAPPIYPAVDRLTRPLRQTAARRGDLGGVSLWAGAGWRAAADQPAAQVLGRLAGLCD